jgi:hypothetical protein
VTPRRQTLAITGLLVLLTVVMTWPQAAQLATGARQHHDVFFNMWRLGWAAHALAHDPLRFFDGNIFFPEPRTLTLSDAMLVEALVAAPLLWMGLPQVLVHNLLLLGAIVASGTGAFVLARHLTGSAPAAMIAALVFAFAPYRFEHYMHMELQWGMWLPWTFWGVHRTLETGSRKMGLLTGLFGSLQMMSSVYYGIFLATLCVVGVPILVMVAPREQRRRALVPLAAGALVAGVLCGAYAMPYLATRQTSGIRDEGEVRTYSATPFSYRVATPDNLLYGSPSGRGGRPERRLFPGVVPVLLAAACLLRRPSKIVVAYAILLALTFEMSLGLGGFTYRVLYDYVPGYDGLRAPARLGLFFLLFLGVLAAGGQSALLSRLTGGARHAVTALVTVMVLIEYWVAPIALVPFPSTAPPLYAWLASQPPGPVIEFPLPTPESLPGQDARYAYMSTFHWKPIVNGYSGYYPEGYLNTLDMLRQFPAIETLERLHRHGVRYVIVHEMFYDGADFAPLHAAITSSGALAQLGRFNDGAGAALVYRLR